MLPVRRDKNLTGPRNGEGVTVNHIPSLAVQESNLVLYPSAGRRITMHAHSKPYESLTLVSALRSKVFLTGFKEKPYNPPLVSRKRPTGEVKALDMLLTLGF